MESLKSAYIHSDAGKFESILSERSKDRIRSVIKIFSSMDENQLKALSRKFGTDADELKNLTIKSYLSLQLSLSKKTGEGIFQEMLKYKVVGVDSNNNKANVRIENGMEFLFIKEGPYWKFDMKE